MNFSPVSAALAPDIEAREVAGKLLRSEIAAFDKANLPQPNAETRVALSRQAEAQAVACNLWRAFYLR